jgi:hypothetical protein
MERAHARIPAPGKNQFRGTARADELIVNEVRRHAHQGEIAPPLADDFVSGGKRDQMGEALQRHHIAVADHLVHSVF